MGAAKDGISIVMPNLFITLGLTFTCLCATTVNAVIQDAVVQDYCHGGSFEARCQKNEVIMMTHALYGRMRANKCVDAQVGHMGCKRDILTLMDKKCSGKQTCDVLVSDFIYDNIAIPCHKDVNSYLEAAYRCIEVVAAESSACRGSPVLALNPHGGHLASKLTHDTRIGSDSCPWTLQVPRGKTINITLYDFGVHTSQTTGPYYQKYFVIREAGSEDSVIYAATERVRTVYSSTTNEVQVDIFDYSTPKTMTNFVIRYEAVGCEDPPLPQHSQLEKTGSIAIVTCDHRSTSWKLTCKEQSWVGKLGNCTQPGAETSVWMVLFGEDWSSPTGILIVIGFGVALGIIIGLILLAVAIICMKRLNYFEPGRKLDPRGDRPITDDLPSPCKFSTETDMHQLSQNYQEPLVRDSVQRVYADGVYRASLTSEDSWPRIVNPQSQKSKYVPAPQHIYETPESMNGSHS